MRPPRLLRSTPCLLLCLIPVLLGIASTTVHAQDLMLERQQTRWRIGLEQADVGAKEDVTLVGVHYDVLGVLDLYEPLYAGVAGFASISGDVDGFFLAGFEAGAVWSPRPRWIVDAGLFLGAGGPAGQGVRRGFATRPYVAAERVFGLWALRGEVALLDLNDIDETVVVSLGISLPSELLLARARRAQGKIPPESLASHLTRVTPRYVLHEADRGTRRRNGTQPPQWQHLAGLGIDYFLTSRLFVPIEVYGGVGGGAEGFVRAGVGLGASIPLLDGPTSFEAKALAITGGGGGFVTGESLGYEVLLGLRTEVTPNVALEVLGGRTSFPTGDYDADTLSVGLSWSGRPVELALDYPRANLAREGLSGRLAEAKQTRVTVQNKFAVPPRSARKKSGARLDTTLSMIGVGVEQPVSDNVSLTARAFGAWDGDVGGYSEGLLGMQYGLDVLQDDRHRLYLAAELGAAGGGDVDIRGGLLFQIAVGWRYDFSKRAFLLAELGSEQASEGSYEAETATIGIGWNLSRAYLR